MTVDELKNDERLLVNAGDIAPIIGMDAQLLREQAHANAEKLGFPVVVVGCRVRIPRIPFLRYLGVETEV